MATAFKLIVLTLLFPFKVVGLVWRFAYQGFCIGRESCDELLDIVQSIKR